MNDHVVIPDVHAKPGVNLSHMLWAGKYIAKHRPKRVIILGDLFDMASASRWTTSWLKAIKRYSLENDLKAGQTAINLLMKPWAKSYKPKLIFITGNHENRLNRLKEEMPVLCSSLPGYKTILNKRGWKVIPFLRPYKLDGILYCHYFVRNSSGQVTGSKHGMSSAIVQAKREMVSCIAGHKQGLDYAIVQCHGKIIRSIIAGSFYQHKEEYLTDQGNNHWHGILHLKNVKNGTYDLNELSIETLKKEYK